ncbi:hypothetical protein ES706_02288 [subsurface metagenome]
MYSVVFVSHSKHDPNLDFFHKIFSEIQTQSVWMEFEDINPPPSLFIRDSVNKSEAIFVLLSKYLVDQQHTNNWVSFEVGLAANSTKVNVSPEYSHSELGLDIWVFEPLDEDINFTVPYCTYYMRYETTLEMLKWLRDMLKGDTARRFGVPATCPYEDCKLDFNYLSRHYTELVNCPACRRRIHCAKWYWDYMTTQPLPEE